MSKGIVERLALEWKNSGLYEGDLVLIHSSLKRTIRDFKATPDDILKSFIMAVGDTGTIILPLFNFGFCSGEAFSIKSTKSKMGALTEAARNYPGAVRTGHPIYSFAVIGAKSNLFKDIDNKNAYGKDSPFAVLHKNGGKVASLNLDDQNSMTFYHYVEEYKQVSWRYDKIFTADYEDADGDNSKRSYQIYVRDIENGVKTYVNPLGEKLWDAGLYSGCKPGKGNGFRIIEADKLFDFVENIIDTNEALGNLYKIEKD